MNKLDIKTGDVITDGLYVKRPEDIILRDYCLNKSPTFLLAPPRLGKSSMIAQIVKSLKNASDYLTVDVAIFSQEIIITHLESKLISEEDSEIRFYEEVFVDNIFGRIESLSLGIKKASIEKEYSKIVKKKKKRPSTYFENFFIDTLNPLLEKLDKNLVIFIDEIGSLVRLPFRDSLFLFSRAVNQSTKGRINFVFTGIASTDNLLKNKSSQSLNSFKFVKIDFFTRDQMNQYQDQIKNINDTTLDIIWNWTKGYPLFTQIFIKEGYITLNAHTRTQPLKPLFDEEEIKEITKRIRRENERVFGLCEDMLTDDSLLSSLGISKREILSELLAIIDRKPIANSKKNQDNPDKVRLHQHLLLSGGFRVNDNSQLEVSNKLFSQFFEDIKPNLIKQLRECIIDGYIPKQSRKIVANVQIGKSLLLTHKDTLDYKKIIGEICKELGVTLTFSEKPSKTQKSIKDFDLNIIVSDDIEDFTALSNDKITNQKYYCYFRTDEVEKISNLRSDDNNIFSCFDSEEIFIELLTNDISLSPKFLLYKYLEKIIESYAFIDIVYENDEKEFEATRIIENSYIELNGESFEEKKDSDNVDYKYKLDSIDIENEFEPYTKKEKRKSQLATEYKREDLDNSANNGTPLVEIVKENKNDVKDKNKKVNIILGDPGSGKTTFVKNLAYKNSKESYINLASLLAGDVFQNENEYLGFPIFIRISQFAEALGEEDISFSKYLKYHLTEHLEFSEEETEVLFPLIKDLIEKGKCLILLDGLDEVINLQFKETAVGEIQEFISENLSETQKTNTFVITSRIIGYEFNPLPDKHPHYKVSNLNNDQIKDYLVRRKPGNEKWKKFHSTIKDNLFAREKFAVNPLLLSVLIAVCEGNEFFIPDRRITLVKKAFDIIYNNILADYKKDFECYFYEKTDKQKALEHITSILSKIAFYIHSKKPSGLITFDELKKLFEKQESEEGKNTNKDEKTDNIDLTLQAFKRKTNDDFDILTPEEKNVAKLLFQDFRKNLSEKGIFVERSNGIWGFKHLLFEEFLSGLYLSQRGIKELDQSLEKFLHKPRWFETLLFCLSNLSEADLNNCLSGLLTGNYKVLKGGLDAQVESVLYRDLFFAARLLTEVEEKNVNPVEVKSILKKLLELYFKDKVRKIPFLLKDVEESLFPLFKGYQNIFESALISYLNDCDKDEFDLIIQLLSQIEVTQEIINAIKQSPYFYLNPAARQIIENFPGETLTNREFLQSFNKNDGNNFYILTGTLWFYLNHWRNATAVFLGLSSDIIKKMEITVEDYYLSIIRQNFYHFLKRHSEKEHFTKAEEKSLKLEIFRVLRLHVKKDDFCKLVRQSLFKSFNNKLKPHEIVNLLLDELENSSFISSNLQEDFDLIKLLGSWGKTIIENSQSPNNLVDFFNQNKKHISDQTWNSFENIKQLISNKELENYIYEFAFNKLKDLDESFQKNEFFQFAGFLSYREGLDFLLNKLNLPDSLAHQIIRDKGFIQSVELNEAQQNKLIESFRQNVGWKDSIFPLLSSNGISEKIFALAWDVLKDDRENAELKQKIKSSLLNSEIELTESTYNLLKDGLSKDSLNYISTQIFLKLLDENDFSESPDFLLDNLVDDNKFIRQFAAIVVSNITNIKNFVNSKERSALSLIKNYCQKLFKAFEEQTVELDKSLASWSANVDENNDQIENILKEGISANSSLQRVSTYKFLFRKPHLITSNIIELLTKQFKPKEIDWKEGLIILGLLPDNQLELAIKRELLHFVDTLAKELSKKPDTLEDLPKNTPIVFFRRKDVLEKLSRVVKSLFRNYTKDSSNEIQVIFEHWFSDQLLSFGIKPKAFRISSITEGKKTEESFGFQFGKLSKMTDLNNSNEIEEDQIVASICLLGTDLYNQIVKSLIEALSNENLRTKFEAEYKIKGNLTNFVRIDGFSNVIQTIEEFYHQSFLKPDGYWGTVGVTAFGSLKEFDDYWVKDWLEKINLELSNNNVNQLTDKAKENIQLTRESFRSWLDFSNESIEILKTTLMKQNANPLLRFICVEAFTYSICASWDKKLETLLEPLLSAIYDPDKRIQKQAIRAFEWWQGNNKDKIIPKLKEIIDSKKIIESEESKEESKSVKANALISLARLSSEDALDYIKEHFGTDLEEFALVAASIILHIYTKKDDDEKRFTKLRRLLTSDYSKLKINEKIIIDKKVLSAMLVSDSVLATNKMSYYSHPEPIAEFIYKSDEFSINGKSESRERENSLINFLVERVNQIQKNRIEPWTGNLTYDYLDNLEKEFPDANMLTAVLAEVSEKVALSKLIDKDLIAPFIQSLTLLTYDMESWIVRQNSLTILGKLRTLDKNVLEAFFSRYQDVNDVTSAAQKVIVEFNDFKRDCTEPLSQIINPENVSQKKNDNSTPPSRNSTKIGHAAELLGKLAVKRFDDLSESVRLQMIQGLLKAIEQTNPDEKTFEVLTDSVKPKDDLLNILYTSLKQVVSGIDSDKIAKPKEYVNTSDGMENSVLRRPIIIEAFGDFSNSPTVFPGLPPGISNTAGWSEEQIQKRYRQVKSQLDWKNTTGSAKKWWEAFENENQHRKALILRLAEELLNRKATITEFFLAYVYSNTDNIQANLCYLDYTRLKKQEELKKKEEPTDSVLKDYYEKMFKTLSLGVTDTTIWNEDRINIRYAEVKSQLDWKNTIGSARKWWEDFEDENQHQKPLILRVAEELLIRKATITEYFLAFVYSNTDNIQANLYYLDYTRLKKQEELKKKEAEKSEEQEIPKDIETTLAPDDDDD